MNTNKKGETLVSIIVGLVIIGIIISSIITIINSSYSVQGEYISNSKVALLKNSTENIVKGLDLSKIEVGEEFYLYKDTENKKYLIFTGATNTKYKFVNENGEYIPSAGVATARYIYSRTILVQKDDNFLGKSNKLVKILITDLTPTK